MTTDSAPTHTVVTRYFDMWNTGDTTQADRILHPGWIDHAHPDVAGPAGVRQAVAAIRAARPGLHFTVHAILGGNGLVAATGSVGAPETTSAPGHLMWLIRLADGLMAEMWTYQRFAER